MELMPEGRNFRLIQEDELPDVLDYLSEHLPESLKFHQTIKTYLHDRVWDFHFYVSKTWPEDPIILHFPGITSLPDGRLNDSFSVFCPVSRLDTLKLLAEEDILVDWSRPIFLNFTHSQIVEKLEEYCSHLLGCVEKVRGDIYVCERGLAKGRQEIRRTRRRHRECSGGSGGVVENQEVQETTEQCATVGSAAEENLGEKEESECPKAEESEGGGEEQEGIKQSEERGEGAETQDGDGSGAGGASAEGGRVGVEADDDDTEEEAEDEEKDNETGLLEEAQLRQLEPEHAAAIHSLYPANNMESVEVFERLIRALPAFGVFSSEGELAAWMVQSYYGAMFSMQTLPAFRRRGYGLLLARRLTSAVLARGYIPFVVIRPENSASQSLYAKLGFRRRYETVRAILRPKGWPQGPEGEEEEAVVPEGAARGEEELTEAEVPQGKQEEERETGDSGEGRNLGEAEVPEVGGD